MFVRLLAILCWALAACQGDAFVVGSDFHAEAEEEATGCFAFGPCDGIRDAGLGELDDAGVEAGPGVEQDAELAELLDAGTDAAPELDAGAAQGEPDAEVCEPNGCGGCGCPAAWAEWGSCEVGAVCAIDNGKCPLACFTSTAFSDEFYCGSDGEVLCAQCPTCGT